MLHLKANGLFNNGAQKGLMIRRMAKDEKDIHPQMQRLYQALKDLRGTDGRGRKAELARLLHVSDQVVNGWEARGVAKDGQIDAAQLLGINLAWLRDGTGEMLSGAPRARTDLQDVADLVSYYGRLAPQDQAVVLRLAQSLLPKG
jgi:DNA-binding transcriptional regulator YiaG